jgi:leucyl aminopeptidase (aminopeptidase T)
VDPFINFVLIDQGDLHIQCNKSAYNRNITRFSAFEGGDKDRIAELVIGLNPGVKQLTGDTMLDAKLVGSVHVAIGKNDHFGDLNHSNFHLDLVM